MKTISYLLVRGSLSVLVLAVAMIPTWIYVGAQQLMGPSGFLENFVLLGTALYFMWTFQIILLLLFIGALVIIWSA